MASYDVNTNRGQMFFAKDIDIAEVHFKNLVKDMKQGFPTTYVEIRNRQTNEIVKKVTRDEINRRRRTEYNP